MTSQPARIDKVRWRIEDIPGQVRLSAAERDPVLRGEASRIGVIDPRAEIVQPDIAVPGSSRVSVEDLEPRRLRGDDAVGVIRNSRHDGRDIGALVILDPVLDRSLPVAQSPENLVQEVLIAEHLVDGGTVQIAIDNVAVPVESEDDIVQSALVGSGIVNIKLSFFNARRGGVALSRGPLASSVRLRGAVSHVARTGRASGTLLSILHASATRRGAIALSNSVANL